MTVLRQRASSFAVVGLLLAAGTTSPEAAPQPTPRPDLTLYYLPRADSTLGMRQPEDPPPPKPATGDADRDAEGTGNADHQNDREKAADDDSAFGLSSAARMRLRSRLSHEGDQRASISKHVDFHFNLGFGLDGGEPSGLRLASGEPLDQTADYAKLRIYGLGNAAIGTRGLLHESLSSYLAASYRFNSPTGRATTAVPSVQDSNAVDRVQIRSAYAQTDGLFTSRLLRPLSLRAGRQYRYGPAVLHFDGFTLGYETPGVTLSVFSGTRASLYGLRGGVIVGADARIDLSELREVPIVLTGFAFRYEQQRHFEGGMAFRPSKDIGVRASLRVRGNSIARERVVLRARLSQTSTIMAELENRPIGDWSYDLLLANPRYGENDRTDERGYLNLGQPLPRVYAGVRAGTVLLDNIDLLFRAGGAYEHDTDGFNEDNPFASTFSEVGLAAEVRLRRSLVLGGSLLGRRYRRPEFPQLSLASGIADPLPADNAGYGERSFVESGLITRYTSGEFRASAELYTRVYKQLSPYLAIDQEEFEFRSGGRFTVRARAGKRLHLRGEYDVAFTAPRFLAPELRGFKSLRVIGEAVF